METLTFYCDDARHVVCMPFSVENLHIMAIELGLHRCWFHRTKDAKYPHYDIPKKRIDEITAKCTLVDARTILAIIKGEHSVV